MAILSVNSKVNSQHDRFDIIKLINDGTTAASSTAVDVRDARGVQLIVETGAGVSNGVVQLEGAASSAYAGTWVSLASITTNAASTTFKGAHGCSAAPIPYVRARISTGLTGGSCDVYLMVLK
jgi:hypothetical protein